MKFVDKQLAIKLKEKGFDKPCFGYYHKVQDKKLKPHLNYTNGGTILNLYNKHIDSTYVVDAPTIDQVLEWLREEKNIFIWMKPYHTYATKNNICWDWNISIVNNNHELSKYCSDEGFAEYEYACIAGIEFVVKHLI